MLFEEHSLKRTGMLSENLVGQVKPPCREIWSPKHRRTASQSNVIGVRVAGLLSPMQKRERRLKTRSFDCPRSLAHLGLGTGSENEDDTHGSPRRSRRSVSVTTQSSGPCQRLEPDHEELAIDPKLEGILQSTFDAMPDVSTPAPLTPSDANPESEAESEAESALKKVRTGSDGKPKRAAAQRRHRRCQSILIRSTEAIEEENIDVNINSDENDFLFNGFEFSKAQEFSSLPVFSSEMTEDEIEFTRALAESLARTYRSNPRSEVSAIPPTLPTIREY